MNHVPILTLLVLTPWVGAFVLGAARHLAPATARWLGLLFSLSTLALGFAALASFSPAHPGMQLVEQIPWIAALNVHYHLGLDGLSLVLVLLTGLIAPTALLASRRIDRAPRVFNALFLALQGSALGVFLALDFVHWFVFWELSLVPAFFLLKIWGGPGSRPRGLPVRDLYDRRQRVHAARLRGHLRRHRFV